MTAVNTIGLPIRMETLSDYIPFVITGLLIIITLLLDKIRKMAIEINKLKSNPEQAYPEGYDKFVAESREWAFGYIEQVQKNLQDLAKVASSVTSSSKSTKQNLFDNNKVLVGAIDDTIKDLLPKQINER